MEQVMPYVTVRQQHQVTIPLEIRKRINLHEGDTLEAKELNGVIILTPQMVIKKSNQSKKQESSLISLLGANKGSGLYKDSNDVSQYIDNLRNEWD